MKKLNTVMVLLCFSIISMAQTIPNYEFQEWITEGDYENPEYWSTSNNPILSSIGVIPVSKSIDAFVGDYSARLETKDVALLGLQIPGIITLAQINIVVSPPSYSISGGLALQENVSKLTGMYKYEGVEGDSATVIIYNFKHDEGSDFDTIGFGVTYLQDASLWTSFTVNMQYVNSHVPDTFNVVFMSSSSPDFTTGAGSVLRVDNIEIETNTGIINLNANMINVEVYPNPTTDYVQFETAEVEDGRMINIYDLGGNLMSTNSFSSLKTSINISNLPSAQYTYCVIKNNSIQNRGSFIKK